MVATTQALEAALSGARRQAQQMRKEVVCHLDNEQAAAGPGQPGHAIAGTSQQLVAIVRPDEPIVFCGLFPQ